MTLNEAAETENKAKTIAKLGKLNDSVVKEHLAMIQSISASIAAGGKLPPGIYFNDLISYGYEGFLKAYSSFDHEKGAQFQTYAAYRVRGEILDRLRKEWKYRNPISYKSVQAKIQDKITEVVQSTLEIEQEGDPEPKEVGAEDEKKRRAADIIANSAVVYMLSLDNEEIKGQLIGQGDIAEELFTEMEFSNERKILWEEVTLLTDQEKDFVYLFYEKEKTQKEIAEIMSVSKSKVSRLHVKILKKLRNRLTKRLNN
ncbi:MAG: hypothetical protein DKM50_04535 [Candidatus Margulisiibacteriota bacterium]|nr:MAG: hypothetical protein A2X43_05675 [Candidatus Margulisbacteria bacterium GWD2_39_127]OGI01044.1 MAG: hypothetical protein A2X42_12315 [Candidatus Margulisbacteria bacterium GWF2_38_17]OGI09573.1 MAG: hypothetical protein A2X41_06520 [Candidatus Margulisbacteria bacterium GWE2_39_32]PZM82018.1 MAG: hypothetical protein DKM50_04535 [Candidatus Margulisiibacteriota bacterium]HCY35861.1 hypothetical protein [Candidatus Margulisiibacteriota bacterium]